MPEKNRKSAEALIVTNRKAHRDYSILEKYEAGIVLKGTEVKSLRAKGANLNDSFAIVQRGEVFLLNLHISPYAFGNRENPEPTRTRKLLLHQHEIKRLIGETTMKGHTLIPLKLYFRGSHVKVELAVAKGKKEFDRRQDIKRREHDREMAKALKHRQRR